MLTRILSRLRRIAPSNRPATKPRTRALNVEMLEAREVPATLLGLSDNNDLLREYGRLVDGGFGFQALTGKESTWSVSSTDWELKFTAKLPPL